MSVPILKSAIEGTYPGFRYDFNGPIWGDEFELIKDELNEILKGREVNIAKVILNISTADEINFKPKRILGVCRSFSKSSKELGKNIKLQLIANEAQFSIINAFKVLPDLGIELMEMNKPKEDAYDKKELSPKDRLSHLDNMAIDLLSKWVDRHPAKFEKQYYISGIEMSAEEFYKEVINKSPIGLEYLDSIIEIGLKLGIKTLEKKHE